jgi:hypothetical protein
MSEIKRLNKAVRQEVTEIPITTETTAFHFSCKDLQKQNRLLIPFRKRPKIKARFVIFSAIISQINLVKVK